jgi:hypothetical protein
MNTTWMPDRRDREAAQPARDTSATIRSLRCADYHLDVSAWPSDRSRDALAWLPDFKTAQEALSMQAFDRHMGRTADSGRLPARSPWPSTTADHAAQAQAADRLCQQAPDRLFMDALVEAIDTTPAVR